MKYICKESGHAVNALNTLRTGEILVEAGFVTSKDIKHALAIQRNKKKSFPAGSDVKGPGRLLGMILCDFNLITPVDLYYVLHKNNKIYTMEKLLVHNEKISRDKTDLLMEEKKRVVYSFFDLIVKYNILTISILQQRIFELYRIPYRYVNRFAYDKNDKKLLAGLLDKNISFHNLAIPMIRKNSSFIMGITDPETLIFIYDLNFKLPHYRIIPVFIPLQHFKSLYRKLYNIPFLDFSSPLNTPDAVHAGKVHETPVLQSLNEEALLFFKYKTTISDPQREKHIIFDLYSKYEILRQLTGKNERVNQFSFFMDFIVENFKLLINSCSCAKLEIILSGEKDRVNLTAKPIEVKSIDVKSGVNPIDKKLIP